MSTGRSEFAFGGRLSLDFTWTLRYRQGWPSDYLTTPEELRRWIGEALAPVEGPVVEAQLARAVALREAIFSAAKATVAGELPRRQDRAIINLWASEPAAYRTLTAAGYSHSVLRPGAEVDSALATIAVDAIDVLTLGDGRLRICDGPGCSLLFHDTSRPGRRRWCSTERCGNRVNTTTYRRRHAGD